MLDSIEYALMVIAVVGWMPALLIGWFVLCIRDSVKVYDERQRRLTLPIEEQEALAEADRIAYDDMIRTTYPLRARTNGWYPFDQ